MEILLIYQLCLVATLLGALALEALAQIFVCFRRLRIHLLEASELSFCCGKLILKRFAMRGFLGKLLFKVLDARRGFAEFLFEALAFLLRPLKLAREFHDLRL